jgi:hypothetical protein
MRANRLVDSVYKKLSGNSDEKVHESIRNVRLSRCRSCPNLMFKGNCSLCGCFVELKTEYKDEACPDGKW